MKKIVVMFELDDSTALFEQCKTVPLSLHEALCKAIHENDEDARDWLNDNVLSID